VLCFPEIQEEYIADKSMIPVLRSFSEDALTLADGSMSWKELRQVGHFELGSSVLVGILCLAPKLKDVRLPVLMDQSYEVLVGIMRRACVKGFVQPDVVPDLCTFGTVDEWSSLI
jgi:hypothetical protein